MASTVKIQKETKKQAFHSLQWFTLATLMISSFLGRLDGTIVNLALPKIISDFGITVSEASWIATAYIIANAIFVPVFGKLGDLIGRKSLYIFGIVGFTASSMLAGLSFNLPSMVIFRILQAIMVSIDYPIALSIIAFTFADRNQRTQAMGIWSAVFAAAAVFGPLLGGPLIDFFGWRSVFYVNVPLGIVGTLMAFRFIIEPVEKIKGLKNFDIIGSIVLGIGLGAMVLVLDQGQTWGWGSGNSIICYIISVISIIAFILIEQRQKEPVVDLKFFKIPTFNAAIVTSFISFMGMIGGIFLIPLFAQTYLGYSVTKTGLIFIPMAFGIASAAQIGGRLAAKFPAGRITAVGMFLGAFGMYLFSGIDIRWGVWDLAWRLFVMAFGLGLGLAPLTQAVTNSVPISEVGVASSILALARNVSGAFGTAIFATILSNSITSNLLRIQEFSTVNTQSPSIVPVVMSLMAVKANITAYQTVFQVAVYFMLAGALSAIFVKSSTSKVQHEGPMEI